MSEYREIVIQEEELKLRLEQLRADKRKFEEDILMTFGKMYLKKKGLSIEDFTGLEPEELDKLISKLIDEDLNNK
ncbi:hypothetical protein [Miniphocaeibacter halophilus]|uniref:Uncharacterized protein n=1 Tax=Miniphocaeibacter halophilus TaxID=2931922 RepID=A0AC61N1N6_9FIRM|nr:hypothetical protein [Miniphocaeibacter halophilus]QQK07733.1 hypothetical protein JFY71_10680 [Miniphocaeibacter halophilus]